MLCRAVFFPAIIALLTGCNTSSSGAPLVSQDHEAQVRFEAARHTLAVIKEKRKRGRIVTAECKTVEALFYKEFKEHDTVLGRDLAKEIKKTCQNTEPPNE